jgi:hypothetical protein
MAAEKATAPEPESQEPPAGEPVEPQAVEQSTPAADETAEGTEPAAIVQLADGTVVGDGVTVATLPADASTQAPDEAEPETVEPAEDVEVIVSAYVSGTRDGEPWPAIGESLTLPADEAEAYLKFGYVRLPE